MSLAKKCIAVHEAKVNEAFGSWKKLKKLLKKYKKPKKLKKPKVAFDKGAAKKKQSKSFWKKLFEGMSEEYGKDKIAALAKSLGIDVEDVEDNGYDLSADGGEYSVLTDSEADQALKDYIEESVWAFNTDFLLSHIDAENVIKVLNLESSYYDEDEEKDVEIGDDDEVIYTNLGMTLEEYVKELQGGYEDNNDKIKKMIGNFDRFVKDAEMSDGRGHFLSGYDGEEIEEGKFYIYRTN